MINLDSKLKSRDITLPKKFYIVKAVIFPGVMYGCESWTIKKAKWQKINAFDLWCWRRPSRVPWTARRSNQPIITGIKPEYSLEGLILKLPYFGYLMRRADSLEKTLMLGKMQEEKGTTQDEMVGWHHWLDGHEFEQSPGGWLWTGEPGVVQTMGSQRVGHNWATELNGPFGNLKFVSMSVCFCFVYRLICILY